MLILFCSKFLISICIENVFKNKLFIIYLYIFSYVYYVIKITIIRGNVEVFCLKFKILEMNFPNKQNGKCEFGTYSDIFPDLLESSICLPFTR